MINWNKKPYAEEEFRRAWKKATFADDAALELGLELSTGSLKTLNRIASEIGMDNLPLWNKPYSVEQFTKAWADSISLREVAQKLNVPTVRGLKQKADELGLKDHLSDRDSSFSKEEFIEVWSQQEYLDDIATTLEVAQSKQSYAKICAIARSLHLPAKKARVYITDTGEDSSAIIADWIDWHADHYKVNPLDTQIKIAAKKVKELIAAKYGTASIKWGLFQWTLALHRGYQDPNIITSMTHQHHLKLNPEIALVAQALDAQDETARSNNKEIASPRPQLIIKERIW